MPAKQRCANDRNAGPPRWPAAKSTTSATRRLPVKNEPTESVASLRGHESFATCEGMYRRREPDNRVVVPSRSPNWVDGHENAALSVV
jgi:hypothetical protein